jgi:hypothetical protein
MNRTVAFFLVATVSTACVWGQHCAPSTQNGPLHSDSVFLPSGGSGQGPGQPGSCGTDQPVCSPVVTTINLTRVVGDVNPDGTLVNPAGLIQNGVVGQYAYIQAGPCTQTLR